MDTAARNRKEESSSWIRLKEGLDPRKAGDRSRQKPQQIGNHFIAACLGLSCLFDAGREEYSDNS